MKITDWAMKKQCELLKRIGKGDRVLIGEYDESIYYTNREATILLRIPEKLWLLNTERARNGGKELGLDIIKRNIGVEADFRLAKKDGIAYTRDRELAVFINDKYGVYVDTKLIKEFPKGAQFFTSGSISAVRVYYENAFIGIVMPTRFAKEETA